MARRDSLDNLFSAVRKAARARQAAEPTSKLATLRGTLMVHQRKLETDRSRHISVISPRQTGKSTGVMLVVSIRCLEKAGAEWVVIGLTRPSVKRIYWSPLKKLNEELELGIKFQDQDLVATFPSGSRVFFVGGETIADVEKLRGGRYDGAVVDECKSYSPAVMESLIHEILQPALNTKRGPLILIGTPGDHLDGAFYMATVQPPVEYETPLGKRTSNYRHGTPNPAGAMWSLHVWTLQDNTAVPHLWGDALAQKDAKGWADDHPFWLREFLGRWVSTDNWLVYRYQSHRHDYTPQGTGRFGLADDNAWLTVCGVDFGARDGCAIVVWAYSPTSPGLWEVHSEVRRTEKGDRYPLRLFVEWYRQVENDFGPFEVTVGDDSMTLVVDTLADEYGVYIEPAEKREKPAHIELFNLDLDTRAVRTLVGSPLTQELRSNRWDAEALAKKNLRVEDRKTPNDVCDAALYAFRWCHHRRAKARPTAATVGTPDWWEALKAAELAQARSQARRGAAGVDDFTALDAPPPLWENWEN